MPETRYAKSGAVRIAYQVVGQGPFDLVFVPDRMSNLDVHWEEPGFSHLLHRLSAFARLILLDRRGSGLSDRIDGGEPPNLQSHVDDVRAVLDAAGSGRAALLGASEGAAISILFAATHPERTRALVLYGGYAQFSTWVMGPEALATFTHQLETAWGSGGTLRHFAPGRCEDARLQGVVVAPGTSLAQPERRDRAWPHERTDRRPPCALGGSGSHSGPASNR